MRNQWHHANRTIEHKDQFTRSGDGLRQLLHFPVKNPLQNKDVVCGALRLPAQQRGVPNIAEWLWPEKRSVLRARRSA